MYDIWSTKACWVVDQHGDDVQCACAAANFRCRVDGPQRHRVTPAIVVSARWSTNFEKWQRVSASPVPPRTAPRSVRSPIAELSICGVYILRRKSTPVGRTRPDYGAGARPGDNPGAWGLRCSRQRAAIYRRRRRSQRVFRDSVEAAGRRPGVLPTQLHPRQAALLVHLADYVRHPELAAPHVHAERDLPAHHGPVSVLPAEPAALAELDPAQSLLQRLLRQGGAVRWPARQGKLLDAASRLRKHVRERLLSAPAEALQVPAKTGSEAGAQNVARCITPASPRCQRRLRLRRSHVEHRRQDGRRRRRRRLSVAVFTSGLRASVKCQRFVVVAKQRRPWQRVGDNAAISPVGRIAVLVLPASLLSSLSPAGAVYGPLFERWLYKRDTSPASVSPRSTESAHGSLRRHIEHNSTLPWPAASPLRHSVCRRRVNEAAQLRPSVLHQQHHGGGDGSQRPAYASVQSSPVAAGRTACRDCVPTVRLWPSPAPVRLSAARLGYTDAGTILSWCGRISVLQRTLQVMTSSWRHVLCSS